jgi:hypothetical protein
MARLAKNVVWFFVVTPADLIPARKKEQFN